MEKLYWQKW